ncbi:HEPN domain-containing protein [Myxococcaceae bacterium GXIMD 01537]
MAFTPNMTAAARRNLEAADALAEGARRDVAGYLYGIAAECAIKAMMANVPLTRRDDAFFAHFPELRTLLRDSIQGRSAKPLAAFINDDRFLNNWDVKMRYADARQILERWVVEWRDQARRAVSAMGS